MPRKESTTKSVFIFTVGMIITKLSSFLLNIALSYKYGTTFRSDAVIISMNIPIVFFGGIVAAIALCFVPIFKDEENNHGDKNKLTSLYINVFSTLVILVCFLIFIFPKQIISVFANGMSEEGIDVSAKITRYVAIASIFVCATGILQGYLQAVRKFALVSIAALPVNILVALSIIISNESSITYCIGIGLIIAYYFQFVVFLVSAIKSGFKYSQTLHIKDERIKILLKMILPVLLGTLLYDLNSIIDKNFASFLSDGNISVLDYSYKIAGAAQGILAYPITTVIYTQLSDYSSKKDIDGVNMTIELGFKGLSSIMIPVLAGMLCSSSFIVSILFERGAFNSSAVKATTDCLIMYLIGMFAISYRALFEKAFYSLKYTKIVLLNTIVTVISNVLFDFLLYRRFGSEGLAFATSASLIISCLFLFIQLKRQTGLKFSSSTMKSFAKILLSTAIMCIGLIICKYLFSELNVNGKIQFVILTFVGIVVYVLSLIVFKEYSIKNQVLALLKRKK